MDGSSPRVLRDERLVRGTLLGGCTLGFGGSKSKYSALRRLFVCPYDPAADGSPVGRLLQLHHSGRGVDARVRRAKRALHLQPPRGHWARRLALLLALVHQPREALAAGGRVVLAHSRQALPSRGIRALCREPRDFVRKCPLCTLLTAVLSGRGGGGVAPLITQVSLCAAHGGLRLVKTVRELENLKAIAGGKRLNPRQRKALKKRKAGGGGGG